ncbi:MAG TPA: HAD hydrolase-like protein [Jatrophihabitantaceae bacterium]|nr:HAD hydrolase-like protein [Jatrophihabitantaceae bacterium]
MTTSAVGGTDGRWTAQHRNPRFVLFDLDGTVSDSERGILAALRYAFAANGLDPLPPDVERAILGPPFYESLPPLIGDVPLAAVIDAYRSHYGDAGMFDTRVFDGVAELLAALRTRGTTLAVATSKPEHYAVPIVEYLGLADAFTTVGGDELDGSLPTKALVLAKVLHRLGDPDPRDVLMVGDRVHDVDGAREHGIDCVGAGWGYGLPGELDAAALICATPRDLARAFGLDVDGLDAAAS